MRVQPCYLAGDKAQGVTPHMNQQWLKKIITPKKYPNSSKNTHFGEIDLARPTARTCYMGNTVCI